MLKKFTTALGIVLLSGSFALAAPQSTTAPGQQKPSASSSKSATKKHRKHHKKYSTAQKPSASTNAPAKTPPAKP